MKTLTLVLVSAMFGVAIHIQIAAPEPAPVELSTVAEWPSPFSLQSEAGTAPCRAGNPGVFAWWPVADYFVSALLARDLFSDPLFLAARRCA